MTNTTRILRVLTFLGGGLLVVIGIRFYLIPEHAARIFGIRTAGSGFELHTVVAARDVWLGLLAIGLAWLKEWRALGLWFALGFSSASWMRPWSSRREERPGRSVFTWAGR